MDPYDDPFDDLLNLEEEYYAEGYDEGFKDGIEAGRIEGYSLGLQKGFEKFVEAGRLRSKAMVWANRIPKYQQRRQEQQEQQQQRQQQRRRRRSTSEQQPQEGDVESKVEGEEKEVLESNDGRLPPIHSNPRLEKNIEMLYGLVEPGTLSTDNDDEAVNDFDGRIKGANAKLRIIERVIGEGTTGLKGTASASSAPAKNENIEDIGSIRQPAETNSVNI
ncbi:hypothetical protein F5Y03DRAFT_188384 [Xylaria venustula]|nr:hypothetical protein F5Y03DRAFT_188384 [Xylaria venustula]